MTTLCDRNEDEPGFPTVDRQPVTQRLRCTVVDLHSALFVTFAFDDQVRALFIDPLNVGDRESG